jgi:hypothetical protein
VRAEAFSMTGLHCLVSATSASVGGVEWEYILNNSVTEVCVLWYIRVMIETFSSNLLSDPALPMPTFTYGELPHRLKLKHAHAHSHCPPAYTGCGC